MLTDSRKRVQQVLLAIAGLGILLSLISYVQISRIQNWSGTALLMLVVGSNHAFLLFPVAYAITALLQGNRAANGSTTISSSRISWWIFGGYILTVCSWALSMVMTFNSNLILLVWILGLLVAGALWNLALGFLLTGQARRVVIVSGVIGLLFAGGLAYLSYWMMLNFERMIGAL